MRSTRVGSAAWVQILVSAISVGDCLKSEAPECMHHHSIGFLEGSLVGSGIALGRMTAEETPKL